MSESAGSRLSKNFIQYKLELQHRNQCDIIIKLLIYVQIKNIYYICRLVLMQYGGVYTKQGHR